MRRRYRRRRAPYRRRRRRGYGKRRNPYRYNLTRWGVKKYNIHKFRRYSRPYVLDLTSNPTGESLQAYNFNLQDVTNYTELTAIYDQFRIDYITLKLTWSPKVVQSANVNNPGQTIYPILWYAKDYDDIVVPATLATLKERGNLRSFRLTPNREHKISLKPAVLGAMYQSAVATAYSPKWNQKIDMTNSSTPHYGIKMCADYLPLQDLGEVNIEAVYHITCFGTR